MIGKVSKCRPFSGLDSDDSFDEAEEEEVSEGGKTSLIWLEEIE